MAFVADWRQQELCLTGCEESDPSRLGTHHTFCSGPCLRLPIRTCSRLTPLSRGARTFEWRMQLSRCKHCFTYSYGGRGLESELPRGCISFPSPHGLWPDPPHDLVLAWEPPNAHTHRVTAVFRQHRGGGGRPEDKACKCHSEAATAQSLRSLPVLPTAEGPAL